MNQKEVFIISVTVFLTVLAWIASDLIHVSKTIKLPDNDPQLRKPITVELNTTLFDELQSRSQ